MTVTRAAAFVVAAALAWPAAGASYPARPVRVIVPFPPGGSTDIYSRFIGRELAAAFGQAVVVDNRPGGTGVLGTQVVRQASADGHTLLFTSNTAHVLGPLVRNPPPFDPVRDFTPIAMAVRFPLYLVAHASVPAKTVKELVAYAKSQQGRINYASSGEGGYSHIAGVLFNSATGIDAVHVPYKGAAPAQQAVVSGEAQYRFDNVGTSQPLVLAGRLRGYALTGTTRSAGAPDVPTLAEIGVTGLESIYTWLGMLGPPKLSAALRDRIAADVLQILKTPDLVQKASKDGYEIVAAPPAQFASDMRKEVATLERVIARHGLKAH